MGGVKMNKRIMWKKIKQRGPILQNNASGIMRDRGNIYEKDINGNINEEKIVSEIPNTYTFENVQPYYSYSALCPSGNKKNPFEFVFLVYDEDENCVKEWETTEVKNPLKWQTEKEFLKSINN